MLREQKDDTIEFVELRLAQLRREGARLEDIEGVEALLELLRTGVYPPPGERLRSATLHRFHGEVTARRAPPFVVAMVTTLMGNPAS